MLKKIPEVITKECDICNKQILDSNDKRTAGRFLTIGERLELDGTNNSVPLEEDRSYDLCHNCYYSIKIYIDRLREPNKEKSAEEKIQKARLYKLKDVLEGVIRIAFSRLDLSKYLPTNLDPIIEYLFLPTPSSRHLSLEEKLKSALGVDVRDRYFLYTCNASPSSLEIFTIMQLDNYLKKHDGFPQRIFSALELASPLERDLLHRIFPPLYHVFCFWEKNKDLLNDMLSSPKGNLTGAIELFTNDLDNRVY